MPNHTTFKSMGPHARYQAIAWVDPQRNAQWVAPAEGNAWLVHRDLGGDAKLREALETARRTLEVTLTHAGDLPNGEKGMLVCVPIFIDEKFGGYIVGVFNVRRLLDSLLERHVARGYRIAYMENLDAAG